MGCLCTSSTLALESTRSNAFFRSSCFVMIRMSLTRSANFPPLSSPLAAFAAVEPVPLSSTSQVCHSASKSSNIERRTFERVSVGEISTQRPSPCEYTINCRLILLFDMYGTVDMSLLSVWMHEAEGAVRCRQSGRRSQVTGRQWPVPPPFYLAVFDRASKREK